MRRDPDQNDKQHDCEAQQPPHHQLAGTFSRRVRQIINEAQQRSHSLPPDCLPSSTVVVMYAAPPVHAVPVWPRITQGGGVERSRATDVAGSEAPGTPAAPLGF